MSVIGSDIFWILIIVGLSVSIGWTLCRMRREWSPNGNRCACGCTDLIRYSSLNMKQCPDCKTEIPWHLSDWQKPLVGSNRQDRKLNIDVNDGLVNTPNQTVNKPDTE